MVERKWFQPQQLKHRPCWVQKEIKSLEPKLPANSPKLSWPIGVNPPFKPTSRWDIISWDYFTEDYTLTCPGKAYFKLDYVPTTHCICETLMSVLIKWKCPFSCLLYKNLLISHWDTGAFKHWFLVKFSIDFSHERFMLKLSFFNLKRDISYSFDQLKILKNNFTDRLRFFAIVSQNHKNLFQGAWNPCLSHHWKKCGLLEGVKHLYSKYGSDPFWTPRFFDNNLRRGPPKTCFPFLLV